MLSLQLVLRGALASSDYEAPYLTKLANAYEDLIESPAVADSELAMSDAIYINYRAQIVDHQYRLFDAA
jgi:hypothetical protein